MSCHVSRIMAMKTLPLLHQPLQLIPQAVALSSILLVGSWWCSSCICCVTPLQQGHLRLGPHLDKVAAALLLSMMFVVVPISSVSPSCAMSRSWDEARHLNRDWRQQHCCKRFSRSEACCVASQQQDFWRMPIWVKLAVFERHVKWGSR